MKSRFVTLLVLAVWTSSPALIVAQERDSLAVLIRTILDAEASMYEARVAVGDASARASRAWAASGGHCGDNYLEMSHENCNEQVREWEEHSAESRESATTYRGFIENLHTISYSGLVDYLELFQNGALDRARSEWNIADECENNAALALDNVDQARNNAGLGRNIRIWTRAAENYERSAEAWTNAAKAHNDLADLYSMLHNKSLGK